MTDIRICDSKNDFFFIIAVASSLQTCQQDDFIRLQTECRDQNKRFTDAEKVAADDERGPVSEICT